MTIRMSIAGVSIIILLGITYSRNAIWLNEGTLWFDVIEKSVGNGKARGYYNLGRYEESFKPEYAIISYTRAIQMNPKHANAFMNRGNVLDKMGFFEKAIQDYDRAIEIQPQHHIAYYNRGVAYLNKAQITNAIADFTKTIELNPAYSDAYIKRGNAYFANGDQKLAKIDYQKACELRNESGCEVVQRGGE